MPLPTLQRDEPPGGKRLDEERSDEARLETPPVPGGEREGEG